MKTKTKRLPGDLYVGQGRWAGPDEYTAMSANELQSIMDRRKGVLQRRHQLRSGPNATLETCGCGGVLDPQASFEPQRAGQIGANQQVLPLPSTSMTKEVSVHQGNVLPLPSTI